MNGWGLAPPNSQDLERMGQQTQVLMPVVKRIISGENVEGITPKMAQRLMDIFKPDDLKNMYDRGLDVNPNWYQNYIQPGVVNPQTYNAIMNYSRAFGAEDTPEALRGGFTQWGNDPSYTLTNALPNFRQTMLNDAYAQQRMGMQGLVYDPYLNDWVYDPKIGDTMISMAMKNLDVEAPMEQVFEPNKTWRDMTWGDVKGVVSNAINKMGSDTTLPIVPRTELDAAVSAIKGYPASVGGNDLPSSVSMRHFQEASELGLTPREYEGVKNTVTKTILDNPNNPAVWSEVMSMLAQSGLTVQKLDQLRPDWWVQLRDFMTGKTR